YVQILRPEYTAKQHEFAINNVEHQEWLSVDLDKRCCKKEKEQGITKPLTVVKQFTTWLFGINPLPFGFCSRNGSYSHKIRLNCRFFPASRCCFHFLQLPL